MTDMPNARQFDLAPKLPRPDVALVVQVKTPGGDFQTLNSWQGPLSAERHMLHAMNVLATRWSLSGVFSEAEFRIVRVNNPE